jgi:PKD domain-containing protein
MNAHNAVPQEKIMKNALFCLLVWLATAVTLSAGTRVIPIAGHLPGANGSSWTTDVSLTNNDAAPNTVELVFHSDTGLTVSRTVSLAAGSSLLLDDAVRPDSFPGVSTSSWIGQLEVRSAGNISASARTFTTASAGGTYGSAYESYDPAVLSSEGAMSGLLHSAKYRSNVAYANSSNTMAVISYNLRGENGALLASNLLTVPAHSTIQLPLARDVAPSDARVLVEWTSTTPLYVIASVVDNFSNDPTNIPSANAGTELFYPVVGRTAGAQSTFWSTSASISSRADVPGEITFAYRDNASGQLSTKTVPVSARGTVDADDLNAFLGAAAGSGSLTVTSTVRVVAAVRVFNTLADGSTYGSALLAQDNAVRSSLVLIKGVRRDAAYRLNVSLSSHSSATDGTIRLRDDNGQEVESEPFHLEAEGMMQVNLSRGAEVHSGEVEVETHNGVSITAVASSIDNSTGDTSVRESEQENERQHDLEIRISPATGAIGAPIDFSIGNGSGVSSVLWSFGDGTTGTGIAATHTYTRAGEFGVTAEVTLTSGAIVRDQEDVHILSAGGGTVGNGPIDFSWSPLAPLPGQAVTFTASRTSTGGSFKWKFPGNVRPTGAVASFTFAAAGSFEVELELEHEGNTTLHATHVVTVGGGSNGGGGTVTSIDFTWSPVAPAAGQSVTFTASGGNGGAFVFKFPGNVRKSGSSVTFTFASAGSYEVELEQEKEGSVTLHATHVVNVGGGSNGGGGTVTSVDFTWSPASPRAGQAVTFTATSDAELPAGASFKWRMPDNSRPQGKTATYTFAQPGTYKIRVEIEHGGVDVERERNVVIAP